MQLTKFSPFFTLTGIVLVALIYTGMAHFGLMMAVPPGYATVFWPASGLALAAVYCFGYRMLPGVYLGSFLSNWLNYYPFENVDQAIDVGITPALIAVGAVLQAFAGAYLLRRYIGHKTMLVRFEDNVKLSALAGPVASLISCSFACTMFYLRGTVPADAMPFTWATWYVGDTLGVLVFTPLLILIVNGSVSLRRKVLTTIPLLVLFGLVILMFFAFKQVDEENNREEFDGYVSLIAQELDQHFDSYIRDMDAFMAFFGSSRQVDQQEFLNYSQKVFNSLQDAIAVSWAAYVPPGQLDRVLARYKMPDLTIGRYNSGKFEKMNVPDKDPALVVLYHYSNIQRDSVSGINLFSNQQRREAVERAVEVGQYQITAPLQLLGEKEKGFLLLAPLYYNMVVPLTPEQRRDNLTGALVLVYNYSGIFRSILSKWEGKGIHLNVYDMSNMDEPVFSTDPNLIANSIRDLRTRKDMVYKFLGRTLYFTYFLDPAYSLAHTTWSIWYAFVISLGLTFICTIFLLVLTGQTALVEDLVEDKTKELEDRNTFLRMIMDNVPDFIFVKNNRFEIVNCNKSFLQLYHPDARDSVVGISGLEGFPLEEWEGYLRHDKKALEEGYSETQENITDYRGITSTYLTKKVRFEDANGNPLILGIARDVTDFLTVQKKLQAILDTTADGLITIRQSGVIETFNHACERIFGYKAEEVIGSNVTMLMPVSDALHHGNYMFNYTPGQSSKVIGQGREIHGLRKNGEEFPMYLAVAEVNIGGRLMFSGIIRDITKEKEMIEALEASRKELQKSNKELEQFAYVASHDLKAPLRHVNLSAGFLKEQYAAKLDEKAQKFLDVMVDSSNRMQEMIESLLEYSRVGRDVDKHFVDVDLKSVVEDVKETLSEAIAERGVSVSAKGLPVLKANRVLMTQLFQNLIQNAIKYCEADVKPKIKIAAEKKEKFWEIKVADNGIGIDPEYAEKIFLVFQRLHGDGKYEGTGIGLSICQRIVEFHGGEIRLDKTYKGGSQFIINFPLVD